MYMCVYGEIVQYACIPYSQQFRQTIRIPRSGIRPLWILWAIILIQQKLIPKMGLDVQDFLMFNQKIMHVLGPVSPPISMQCVYMYVVYIYIYIGM